jgi:hypothetical protein
MLIDGYSIRYKLDLMMWNDVVLVYGGLNPDEHARSFDVTSRAEGTVLVVRPDLVVRISAWLEDAAALHKYSDTSLLQTVTTFCP